LVLTREQIRFLTIRAALYSRYRIGQFVHCHSPGGATVTQQNITDVKSPAAHAYL